MGYWSRREGFSTCFELVRVWLLVRGADCVCGDLLIMDKWGRRVGTKRAAREPEYPFPPELADRAPEDGAWTALRASQNFVAAMSNMLFRRSPFEAVGGFRDLRHVHDWDFALRASGMGRCLYVPHSLTPYCADARNTIRAERALVSREVRKIVENFQRDDPQVCEHHEIELGLAGNRYLLAE